MLIFTANTISVFYLTSITTSEHPNFDSFIISLIQHHKNEHGHRLLLQNYIWGKESSELELYWRHFMWILRTKEAVSSSDCHISDPVNMGKPLNLVDLSVK